MLSVFPYFLYQTLIKFMFFPYKKTFYKKMSFKNQKNLRTFSENFQPQMPKLKFTKTLIFPRALQKLQN